MLNTEQTRKRTQPMKRAPDSSAERAGGLITNTSSGVQLPLRRPPQTQKGPERDPWFTILIASIALGFAFLAVCLAVGLS